MSKNFITGGAVPGDYSNASQDEQSTAFVNVVEVHERDDGTYVFADLDDAKAFAATVDPTGVGRCFRREEVVCDHADALKLIAAECEATPEAEAASLESGVPVAVHAWRKGEDAPYPDKLEAVEYTVYPTDLDALGNRIDVPGAKAKKIVLWVGLNPDVGCVNSYSGDVLYYGEFHRKVPPHDEEAEARTVEWARDYVERCRSPLADRAALGRERQRAFGIER